MAAQLRTCAPVVLNTAPPPPMCAPYRLAGGGGTSPRPVRRPEVGSGGCPYDCSFCGAAVGANPPSPSAPARPATSSPRWTSRTPPTKVTAFRFVDAS